MTPADLVDTHGRARGADLLAAVEHRRERHVVGGDQGLEHRDVDSRARSRPLAAPQRGKDGAECVRARQHVCRLEVLGPRRRRVALVEMHEARGGVDDVRESGALAPGARLAEAGDGAVDQVRVDGGHGVVVDAEARGDPGGEVLHRDVGLAREVADDLARVGPSEVEAEAFLADIDPREVAALVVAPRLELEVALAHVVAAAGALDLDDARAEVGQETGAVRPGEDTCEVEDHEVREGSGEVGHRRSITGLG